MMEIYEDGKGNRYVEVGNIRITYVEAKTRPPEKDWPGSDVIRIQAYQDADYKKLHLGAELPIQSQDDILSLLQAILNLAINK